MNIRKHHVLATLIVAFVVFTTVYSAPLTPIEPQAATRVASNWLRMSQEVTQNRALDESELPAPALQEIGYQGQIVGYLATVPHGYVVVPAYTELPPITLYSDQATLNLGDEDGPALLIREVLAQKIAAATAALAEAAPGAELQPVLAQIATDRRQWGEYTADYATFTRALQRDNQAAALDNNPSEGHTGRYGVMSVSPLMTTSYHQSSPYYNLDPMGDGGRTLVGCVATATSQILAFWRYPVNGLGSKSYNWNGDNSCGGLVGGGALSATFSDGYDWANILDHYAGSETQAQKDAVAELCYETAVAFSMDFGRCGSGASTSNATYVFPTYFNYASDIRQDNRSAFTSAASWFTMLQEDLNRGWPMQYRISNHSIVCDGWQVAGTNQVHINYGWADSHTAWYTVDNLYCNWSGCSPSVEFVIRHIHPNGTGGGTPARSLTVAAPNGGESLTVGSTATISWSSSNLSENVCIQVNRAYPGSAWETIASSTANSGSYNWVVSGAAASAARVRVYGATTVSVGDTSNGNFSIVGAAPTASVTVTSPNGGESWTVGNTVTVNWTSSGLSENVKVELNRNYSSGTWETIAASVANNGSYSFTLAGAATVTARVRVCGVSTSAAYDISNTNFSIVAVTPPPSGAITVSSPNGGQTVIIGSLFTITWRTSGVSGNMRLQIDRNYPSDTWETIISSTTNDGSHSWIVTGPATASARVRVTAVNNSTATDMSDANFSLATASSSGGIALTSPNGGEQVRIGSLYRIGWTAPGLTDNLKIQINRNYPTGTWENIIAVTNNDGGHTWGVTGPATACARIRITAVYNGAITDVSEADFTILATLTSPYIGDGQDVPAQTALSGAYPNPFNPTTQIRFDIAAASPVRLDVYDITGRLVTTLADGLREAGHHSVAFDGTNLSTGVYFVRLTAGPVQSVQRIQLLK